MTKALLMAVLLAGCLTQDAPTGSDVMMPDSPNGPGDAPPAPVPAPMDASGTWGMTLTWGAGTCDISLAVQAEMVVAHGTSGYIVADAAANTTISGTIMCSTSMCHAAFSETGPGRGDNTLSMMLATDLIATSEGVITGSGGVTYEFRDGTSCTQQFSAAGRLK